MVSYMTGHKPIKSSQGTPLTPVHGHTQEVVIVEPKLLPKSSTEKLLSPTVFNSRKSPPPGLLVSDCCFFPIASICKY